MSNTNIKSFLQETSGVTSLEYALLAALIAVVCTVAVSVVGANTRDLFTTICNAVIAAISGGPSC